MASQTVRAFSSTDVFTVGEGGLLHNSNLRETDIFVDSADKFKTVQEAVTAADGLLFFLVILCAKFKITLW